MDKNELIDFMKWLEDDHYSQINCLLDGEFTCNRNLISEAYTKQKLNLSGIVRPEGERPSDEEIIHALDLAQCEIKAMYSKTGYITSNALAVVNKVHKYLKAAAQEGEPLPAEGVAQSGSASRSIISRCKDCGTILQWPVSTTICDKCAEAPPEGALH